MTNTISTKAMGIALRQLYPGAFASYQGIIFRVTSPQNDLLSGILEELILFPFSDIVISTSSKTSRLLLVKLYSKGTKEINPTSMSLMTMGSDIEIFCSG